MVDSDGRTCANCGFLSKRRKETRELVCAEEQYRETGKHDIAELERMPVCAAGVIEFHEMIERPHKEDYVLRVLQADQSKCPKFIEWKRMLSPKEHALMDVFDRLLKDYQERADKRDNANFWRWLITTCATVLGACITAGAILLVNLVLKG